MNTIRNNNAFENEFWRTHNKYKLTPQVGPAGHATAAPPPSPRSQAGPAARVLSVDEAGAGAASAAAGRHSPALAASALGLHRSAGTGRSVGFFEAKDPDIAKVAVMKFQH